jgi:hypothetical protein
MLIEIPQIEALGRRFLRISELLELHLDRLQEIVRSLEVSVQALHHVLEIDALGR